MSEVGIRAVGVNEVGINEVVPDKRSGDEAATAMRRSRMDELTRLLWPEGNTLTGLQVHAVLDGARDPRIEPMLRNGRLEHACLLAGPLSAALSAAAPYVVHLAADSPQTERIFEMSWGNDWGWLTVAPADVTLLQLRKHFRTLLRVRDEDGRRLMFRFYDPRVMRVYLPTCTPEELRQVFGPVPQFLLANTARTGLARHAFDGERLTIEDVPLG